MKEQLKYLTLTLDIMIDWERIINLKLDENIINKIYKCFHENPDDKKLKWLNSEFDDIFKFQIFVDEINKSKYIRLDMDNRRVIRKLNADASEFIPGGHIANSILNPNALEYISHRDMDILVNSMLNDLIN